jgi:translocation and assembly module TamB
MTARQRRFWWAAGLLGALVGGVTIAFFWATESNGGRQWVLTRLVSTIDGAFGGRGHLKVGALREIGWSRIVADSVSIVDSAGVAVIAIGHLDGSLDLPALLDRRIHLRVLNVEGLRVDMHRDFVGPWNLAYIIANAGDTTTSVPGPPGFGDDIAIDTLRVSAGEITTIGPWAPNAIFTGAARDSVIAVRDSLHDIIRRPEGLLERRRVSIERLVGHQGIIMRPDKKPSSLEIDSLRGKVSDPPVRITAAAGRVQWTPDSLRLDLPSVALPASTGSAEGRVWWNQPGAVRFDVTIKTQAALSDLTWIWDVLPTTGGGTATVRMRTLESADDAEYALSDLDVRSETSHITGRINVVVRPADLLLQKVDLRFAPITASLMRRLSYEAVPADVDGTVTGQLLAETGGSLKNFLIDRLDARFTDAKVPGAVSSVRAAGTVVMGVEPSARNVTVSALQVDLRSAKALAPTLPPVDGMLAGSGRIVAADLRTADVRDLAMTWTDALGNVSAVRGDARIGYGLRVPTVDLALDLDPISMKALARLDTTLKVSSVLAGRLTATGALDSLTWRAVLGADSASRVAFDGTAAWLPTTWRVSSLGQVSAFDAHLWTGQRDMPVTALTGTVALAASGRRDSAGVLSLDDARSTIALQQTEADDRPAFDVLASAVLDAERLRVDSATVHVGGITMDARGALARRGAAASGGGSVLDTLTVSATADTLENVRRQLTRLAATLAPIDSAGAESLRAFAGDTIKGDASLSGYLVGSLEDFDATLALGARAVQYGAIRVGRIFGSLRAEAVRTRASFEGAATADAMDGIGAIRIASAEFRVLRANPDSGELVLDASSADDAHLVIRGKYRVDSGTTAIVADSLRFVYDSVTWQTARPIRILSNATGLTIDSLEVRSTQQGVVALAANVPREGTVGGRLYLERFPVGEAAAFALGTRRFSGVITGSARLQGTRAAPLIDYAITGDSLGLDGTYLPKVSSDGAYANRKMVAHASITDSLGGSIKAEARVPMDLSIATVEKRLLSDAVDADVTADSLRLEALDITVAGVDRVRGAVAGHIAISGTMERPVGTGTIELSGFSARSRELGIEPTDGRAVVRAVQDSLILESFRIRSGRGGDTLGVRGALRYALNEPATMEATMTASNVVLAAQRDGTDLVLSGTLHAVGPLKKPAIDGSLFVPRATIVIDPLGASTALDLTTEAARTYLSASELPTVEGAGRTSVQLGEHATVSNVRLELGDGVWVRTPEAVVKLAGNLTLNTKRDVLLPEGEITANRGQYRLDLNVVSRAFTIDSGRVRFFGDEAIAPSLDISATNVVRLATGDEIPVGVHIGGTIERPLLTLSSDDPLYASAPESEIISLLVFGAPTFALDRQRQSTVSAVTGVLLPGIAGGVVEGALQQLFPVFNTVQVNTAAAQDLDPRNVEGLLDNVSITAGKQLGTRTFLRLNTVLCRASGQQSRTGFRGGVAVEYRLARGLSAQMGVDPGSAPCSRLGTDLLPSMQFGFDIFRDWIF